MWRYILVWTILNISGVPVKNAYYQYKDVYYYESQVSDTIDNRTTAFRLYEYIRNKHSASIGVYSIPYNYNVKIDSIYIDNF